MERLAIIEAIANHYREGVNSTQFLHQLKLQVKCLLERRGCLLKRVGIVGVGLTKLRPTTPELSYKELTFEAAVTAYADAGVDPRLRRRKLRLLV